MKLFRGMEVITQEYRATDKVPLEARAFSFWDHAALWFAAASLPAAWLYGGLMTGAYGLPGALILIFLVSTLTFIPWALIGYIAADKGASSTTLLRPAFGLRGSKLPSVFYLVFGFGWAAVNVFIAAISMSFVFNATLGWPHAFNPVAPFNYYMIPSILIVCAIQGIFSTAGHRAIRLFNWASTVALVALGAYETYLVLKDVNPWTLLAWQPPQTLTWSLQGIGGLNVTYTLTFALLVDLLIAYNWTWEFIGDFSRFSRTKAAGTWGPMVGASLAQYWFFVTGALLTVHAFVATPPDFSQPVNFAAFSDPSFNAAKLGFGLGAYLVILFATVATNAGNIYASALGISNIHPGMRMRFRRLLLLAALIVVPLAMLPLISTNFVFTYIIFLDFLGALVVPLWTLTLVDYFLVKGRKYHDDLFRVEGGQYWYWKGWNWPAIVTLLLGTVVYWGVAVVLPDLRQNLTASGPTILFVVVVYYLWGKSTWVKHLKALREKRLVEAPT